MSNGFILRRYSSFRGATWKDYAFMRYAFVNKV